MKYAALAIIILCGLGLIIYSNIFYTPFHWDDDSSIVRNFSIRSLQHPGSIFNFWPTRFLTYLSFAVDYRLHQLNVFGYHFVNVVIHVCAGIAAWRLVLLLFASPALKTEKIAAHKGLIALFAGALFVAHPLQTQAVTYIAQRCACLATLLYLTSLVLYIKSRLLDGQAHAQTPRRLYYAGALIVSAMAMFTKEMTITLPFMVLFCEFFFFKGEWRMRWRKVPPFLLTLIIMPATMVLTGSVDFAQATRFAEQATPIAPWQYFLTQIKVMMLYIKLLFIPLGQNLDYDFPVTKSFGDPLLFVSALVAIGILFFAVKSRSRFKLISFGIFWFFITLIPESSFIPIKDVAQEHRLYLPLFGYCVFLASGAYYLVGNRSFRVAVLALVAAVCGYSALSYNRNFVWKDELSLWSDVVRKSPAKARGYYNRGLAYQHAAAAEPAMADFNKALAIKPDLYQAYNNRGILYFDRGQRDLSMSDLNRALAINPRYAESYNNRGVIYASEGNFDQALSDFNRALENDPSYVDAYVNRAVLFRKKGENEKSREDMRKVEALGGKAR